MLALFPKEKIILPLPDAVFEYYPNFFSREEADQLFEKLQNETPWQQDDIVIFGKNVLYLAVHQIWQKNKFL